MYIYTFYYRMEVKKKLRFHERELLLAIFLTFLVPKAVDATGRVS